MISRRSTLMTAAAALALGATGARAQAEDEKQLYEAAKKEGQVSWYSGVLTQPICNKVAQTFSQKYPGISASAIKTTSQVAFQRLLQDIKAGQIQSDVFTTADAAHVPYLRSKDLLVQYRAPDEKDLVKSLQNWDPDGYAQVSWLGLVVLSYNTKKVQPDEAPKDWPDLTNAKWKNQLAFGSPNYSGLVGIWTVVMFQKYGWDFFEKLNDLNPLIGRSIDDTVTVLNSGERSVGASHLGTVLRSANNGNPVGLNYPASGVVAGISPSVIMKGAPHPNAAKLFMNFLAGPEYSQILAENFEIPLRPDVASPKGAKPLAEINFVTPTIADIEKNLPKIQEKWRDTFGG